MVERFIRLFGTDCIDFLMADREFVSDKWIEYLNDRQIPYYIRIRNNFKVFIPHKNKEIKAWWLFNNLKTNEFLHYHKIAQIGTQLCHLSGCKLGPKNNRSDFLIIISFNKPEQAQINYKDRWQIETCFRAMKSSGSTLKNSHLLLWWHLSGVIKLEYLFTKISNPLKSKTWTKS